MTPSVDIAEAFVCSVCKSVSLKQSTIEKCIEKHKKESDLKKKEKHIENFIKENYLDVFKKNLVPTNPSVELSRLDSFSTALITAASHCGQQLDIDSLILSEIKSEKIYFRISGKMKKIPGWSISNKILHQHNILRRDFNKVLKKYYRIHKILTSNYTIYFGDFIESIGLHLNSGGGGESFSYEISINRKDFPNINREIEEYLQLLEKNNLYNIESLKLKKQYDIERFPYILISDISYSIMKSDMEILEKKKKELLMEIKNLENMLLNRRYQLSLEDSLNVPAPDSSFNFDKKRYNLLSDYLHNIKIN